MTGNKTKASPDASMQRQTIIRNDFNSLMCDGGEGPTLGMRVLYKKLSNSTSVPRFIFTVNHEKDKC